VAKRKLVLQIVDDSNMMATDLSLGSFICGFKQAWQMAGELNNYDNRRSTPVTQAGLSAYSVLPRKTNNKKCVHSRLDDSHTTLPGFLRPLLLLNQFGIASYVLHSLEQK
jgi:hypothetical protein